MVLKNADKKTQVFTYWNDSGFYQYQYMKEQIDQAKIGKVQLEENQQAKQIIAIKETEPVNAWIYVAVLTGLVGGYLVYKRY